jgi:hypothetical protein
LRIAGPSVAERDGVGCKEQRSAEYWKYSSERRRSRVGRDELRSAMPFAGGLEPAQGSNKDSRPDPDPSGDVEAFSDTL